MKVLVVDDDVVDQELIKRTLLKGEPNSLIEITDSVDDALVKIKEASFDAVLLDYTLPQRNGVEFLLEIKSDRNLNKMAVIMLSNLEDENIGLECIRSGAQDFISKSEINTFRLRRAILAAQARFELEEQLFQSYQAAKKLAENDSLTGLSNRYIFDNTLKQVVSNHQRHQEEVIALILFDLDHFKYINDNHGHSVGDKLLVQLARRVTECLRPHESFYRLGGDEFAVLLSNLKKADDAAIVAMRIHEVINKPFIINDLTITTTASTGIAIYPDDASSAQDLFKLSDIAMYRSKRTGRNIFTYYKEEMQNQFLSEFVMERNMRKALVNNDFTLLYQPIMNVDEDCIIGMEALIRWTLDGELLSPDTFIPVAEKTKVIIELGEWVITESIKQLSLFNKGRDKKLRMSVNISPIQLNDKNLVPHIAECLAKSKVSPNLIEFELTETALFDKYENTIEVVEAISILGCRIALDDFGTGFSSLSHLQNYPINTVKIDRSIMDNAKKENNDKRLITGLVGMIKSLELSIVAEGIEELEQQSLCKELNIDSSQGYYFDKPLSATTLQNKYLQ